MNYTRANQGGGSITRVFIYTIALFWLWGGVPASAGGQEAHTRRQEAQALLDKGDSAAALALLDRARDAARTIADPYGRASELRYVAELYFKAGQERAARGAFADAMAAALEAGPWYRMLSAAIAVVEMQHSLKDTAGAQADGMAALRSGLLERVDAARAVGEVRRFIAALDGALAPRDLAEILGRIRRLEYAPLRQRALYGLHALQLAPPGEGEEERQDAVPEDLARFPPDAGEWEQALWHALLARLLAAAGDAFAADGQAKKAETVLRHAEGIAPEQAEDLLQRMRKQLLLR